MKPATNSTESPPAEASRPVHRWANTVLAVLTCLAVALVGASALLFHAFTAVVVSTLIIGIASRIRGFFKKDLELGLVKRPRAPELRWYRRQLAVRMGFLVAWLVVARSTIALLPLFEAGADRVAWGVAAAVFAASAALWVVPRRRIAIGTNIAWALGALTIGVLWVQTLLPAAGGAVELSAPLHAETVVIQGGESLLWNHHYIFRSQRHALDVVALADRKLVRDGATGLQRYVCFDEPVFAPADGTVARVVKDRPDMTPGHTDSEQIVGNQVVLDIGGGRFVLMAHLKQGSPLVREGEQVTCGQEIARCGNSGNTSMPHLHVQVQSAAGFDTPGLRTYPIAFRDVAWARDGVQHDGVATALRRGDRLTAAASACR